MPHRVDKEPHIDRIDAKIIADIKDSLFLVADVTRQKQGVYFEAGFALGLKLPVISSVREDDLKKHISIPVNTTILCGRRRKTCRSSFITLFVLSLGRSGGRAKRNR